MKIRLGLLALLAALLAPAAARAQTSTFICLGPPGIGACTPVSATNPLPVTGSFSAGGFTPSAAGARGTPLTVTTSDSSGNLPTGAVTVVSNTGTTNPMYCNVNGVAATTSDQLISANGGWYSFTIPAAVTTLHCIATGGTTTANMLGGSGLATGTGGGSGGGSGSSSTFGAAFPATGTAAGYTDGTNMQPGKVDASGNVLVNPVGVAQGSTTSGQTQALTGCAITAAAPSYTTAQTSPDSCDLAGNKRVLAAQPSQYPLGATAITASATGTTGATTATLAGTSGKTTYICGYSIRANATAAATVTNTITGVITATLSSVMWIAPLASGLGIDEQIFSPCIPASATNTGIAIVSGAPGSGGTVSSKGWGYQL